jgi:hypothetical protein
VARTPPRRRTVLTAAGGRAQSRVLVPPSHLQEVAMKTDITSASTAMPSRFSKVLGH